MNTFKDLTPLYERIEKDFNEDNFCTVVALHTVTVKPIEDCFDYMSSYGRKQRKGMFREDWSKALLGLEGYRNVKWARYNKKTPITVNQFCKAHPKGTFYVSSYGHAFAIKDGVVHDWKEGKRRRLTLVFKIVKEGSNDTK